MPRSTTTSPSEFIKIGIQWMGILGTAFTVFSNSQAFIDFSNFVRVLTDKWRESIAALVNFILKIINVEIDVPYAVLFFCIFSCVVVAVSAQENRSKTWSVTFRALGWFFAATFSALYFIFIAIGATSSDPRMEDQTVQIFLFSFIASLIVAIPIYVAEQPMKSVLRRYFGWIGFALSMVAAAYLVATSNYDPSRSIPDFVEYVVALPISLVFIFMYYVSDPIEITKRTFSIGFVIFVLIVLNFASRVIESVNS